MASPDTRDLASAILYYLQTAEDPINHFPELVRSHLVSGATSIVRSGKVTAKAADAAEATRASAVSKDVALFLVVQDAGEDLVEGHTIFANSVVLRIIDRWQGDANIREVRYNLVRALAKAAPFQLETGHGQGLLRVNLLGRTGHRFDPTYNVDYDALSYSGVIELDLENVSRY